MIQYLILWILLIIKTSKQDIPGIEQLVKVYSYVSGSLESVVTTFLIMLILYAVLIFNDNSCSVKTIITRTCQLNVWFGNSWEEVVSIYSVGSFTYLCFACQKMDAIRTKKIRDGWKYTRVMNDSQMLGTYVGFRYALFILSMIGIITLNALAEAAIWEYIAALIVFIVYFILDIGLSVILHSIWVDRKKTAGTEKPMKNK
mgnify:CR=1 FL=1